MYGFVNHAIELLVLRNFGESTWEKIKKEAQVEMDGQFLVRLIYEDDLTYSIVGAAERVLKIPAADILELFGRMFFDFCQESGYDKILQVLGATPHDFLQNLDALHDHLATIYPGMRAPSFRCSENREDGTLILHYYSEREGLEPIVVGIVKAVASKLHNTEVEVEVIQNKSEECDHVQFAITEKENKQCIEQPELEEFEAVSLENKISPATFCKAFPFHVMFDSNMIVKQSGTSVARVVPTLTQANCVITDVFDMVRPHMDFTFESLLSHINTIFVLRRKGTDEDEMSEKSRLRLKGQMLYIPETNLMLFLCSPSVLNLDDLHRRGLYLSDIPLHDATRDLILLSERFEAEYKLAKNLEILTDKLQQTYRELEDEKKKTDILLYSILPPSVANELRHQRPVPAKKYKCVTILFSGVVGFSEYCARNSDSKGAMKIVKLLNDIYTTFDVLTDPKKNPNVYKVETVGDKYMAVSGLPEPCECQAKCIARLALDIMDLSAQVKMEDGSSLQVTIGIHCGEVVTGVIGKRMPRYCLFGNTVNLTSRTETTGEPGRVNISEDAYSDLPLIPMEITGVRTYLDLTDVEYFKDSIGTVSENPMLIASDIWNFGLSNTECLMQPQNHDPEFEFKYRGPVVMKGKSEPMKVWFLARKSISDME